MMRPQDILREIAFTTTVMALGGAAYIAIHQIAIYAERETAVSFEEEFPNG
jgi:hypothetical protein